MIEFYVKKKEILNQVYRFDKHFYYFMLLKTLAAMDVISVLK